MARTLKAPKRGGKPPAPARPRRRFFRTALALGATLTVWVVAGVALLVGYYALDLPDVEDALAAGRRPGVTLLAADGEVLATFGEVHRRPVHLADLPPALPAAVLATEDRRFHDHFGLDILGLGRALLANMEAGRIVQGGSTITQQVAKNLFLSPERSLKRKVQELMLALWLERRLTKNEILTLYLNRVYFGAGAYGVEAASQRFFDKPAAELTLYQSAMLAGLLKAPSRYNPANSPALARDRANQVLANMTDAGAIDVQTAEAARRDGGRTGKGVDPLRIGRHFADWVMERLPGYVTMGAQDLVVTTTLDRRLQRLAEAEIEATLATAGAKSGVEEAALVTLTPDGAVRAMVGGRNYRESQFNRATRALRQPGSAFKPLVYLAALEAGLDPGSRVLDGPISIADWTPANIDNRYRGQVALTEAFAQSLNTAAVRVAQAAGPHRIVEVARRLGIGSDLNPTLGLALGTDEVSVLDLTAAYGVFANGGIGVWPYAILEIKDGDGRLLYTRQGSGPGKVVSAERVEQMSAMMQEVILSGTGRAAALDRPAAGKTGTSQNFRDAWFVGYTADLVTGLWMGNDDGDAMKRVTGGTLPAQTWKRYMLAAEKGFPIRPLPRPVPEAAVEPLQAGTWQDPDKGFWNRIFSVFKSVGSDSGGGSGGNRLGSYQGYPVDDGR